MLGIILITHGDLGRAYLEVAEQMLGRQQHAEYVSYTIGEDMETFRERVAHATRSVDQGRGVIMMTDMFGGVPSNLAMSVVYSQYIEVISGLNLNMLLKVLTTREVLSIKETVQEASSAAKKYVYILSDIMESAE